MKAEEEMGKMPIRKLLLKQSIPAALGILVLSVYTLVDTLFIGNYTGSIGIAAVTIVSPITFLISSIGLGIGVGGASLISIALGEGNMIKPRKIFGNQLGIVIGLGLLFNLLGFGFFGSILSAFGAHGEVHAAASEYFRFTLVGLPFFMGQMVLNNVLRAWGHPQKAMMVLLAPAILNIGLDALFIAGFKMGLQGAALATAISQLVAVVLGLYFTFRHQNMRIISVRDLIRMEFLKPIASLGSIQFFSQGAMSIVVVLANHMLLKYGGDLAISAYGLALRIMMFAFFPVIGIVQGVMPVIGYNFGARLNDRVQKAIGLAFRASTIIALFISAIAFLAAPEILALFTKEEALVKLSIVATYWFFSAFPLLGVQQISTSYFQAIGRAKPALLLTLFKQFVLIPLLFILPVFWQLDGIWYGIPIAEIASTFVAYGFFKRELKRQALFG